MQSAFNKVAKDECSFFSLINISAKFIFPTGLPRLANARPPRLGLIFLPARQRPNSVQTHAQRTKSPPLRNFSISQQIAISPANSLPSVKCPYTHADFTASLATHLILLKLPSGKQKVSHLRANFPFHSQFHTTRKLPPSKQTPSSTQIFPAPRQRPPLQAKITSARQKPHLHANFRPPSKITLHSRTPTSLQFPSSPGPPCGG